MNVVKMSVTPEQAKLWLDEKNSRNRNLTPSRSAAYATDMRNGNWHETHQGIAFYESGELADGQHRLHAITLYGKPIEMVVAFGVPNTSSIGIDANRPRTTSDHIRISGTSDWIGVTGAAITKCAMIASGAPRGITTAQVVEFCEANRDAITYAGRCFKDTVRNVTTAPIRVAVASAFGLVDSSRLDEFCKVLTSGVMQSPDDVAAIRLREQLMQKGTAGGAGTVAKAQNINLAMRAIKAFASREQIKSLRAPAEPIYPIVGSGYLLAMQDN